MAAVLVTFEWKTRAAGRTKRWQRERRKGILDVKMAWGQSDKFVEVFDLKRQRKRANFVTKA
eukprot:5537743-Pleurochrysis_carterae.AAC.2